MNCVQAVIKIVTAQLHLSLVGSGKFLAAIAALFVTMSVGPSEGK